VVLVFSVADTQPTSGGFEPPLIASVTTDPMDLASGSHPKLPVVILSFPRLIDGDAVWADQRVSSSPTSGCRNGTITGFRQPCTAITKENRKMPTSFTRAFIALAITTIAALGADNSIGTWKLNVEKSKYTPAPMPVKSLTVTREASDGGVKQTVTGERSDGTAASGSYTAKYDGKDVQVTGNAPYDTIAIKQVNANTLTEERKKAGSSYKATSRIVISNGGKTMTTTAKGTNADGKPFTQNYVFDKQ
jgi:hypothetical protein